MVEKLGQQVIELTEKIHRLETHAAYQEDVIDALNQNLNKQHQDVQHLQTQIKLLSDFIKTMKSEMDSGIKLPADELPPPHY